MHHRRIALAATATLLALALASGTAAAADCGYPLTVNDATGTNVTITEEPDRIVTGGASTDQTLWEIGAEDKVVGMWVYFSTYLPGATDRTDVFNSYPDPIDDETAVNLTPDVVLVANAVWDYEVQNLRDRGLKVIKFGESSDLDFVYDKTRTIGAIVNRCDAADRRVEEMQEKIGVVEQTVQHTTPKRVFYNAGSLYTPGNNTFIHAMLETAGGYNIARDTADWQDGYIQLTEEQVVDSDPQWIITTPYTSIPNTDGFNSTTAVQENQTLELASRYISQPAPLLAEGLERIAENLHPRAFGIYQALQEKESWWPTAGSGNRTIVLNETEVPPALAINATASDRAPTSIAAPSVTLTVRGPAEARGSVRAAPVPEDDLADLYAPGSPVTTWRIEPSPNASDVGADLTFTIDDDRLADRGVAPTDLTGFRLNNTDWEPLPTDVEPRNGSVNVTLSTQGFSIFTVAATSRPVAAVTPTDPSVATGESLTLDGSGSRTEHGAIQRYSWTVDGERRDGSSVDLRFDDAGKHTVSLTVTNRAGLNDTANVSVTVEDATETASSDDAANEPDTTDRGGDTTSMPGFTAIVAVTALAVLAALKRTN